MNKLLVQYKEERAKVVESMQAIADTAADEERDMTDTEVRQFEDASKRVDELDEAIERLASIEARNARMADTLSKVTPESTETRGSGSVHVRSEATTYGPSHPENSYFRDLFNAVKTNDGAAWDRLNRHAHEMDVETRAMTSAAGSTGAFSPPKYLLDDYAELIRSGRPVANAVPKYTHPMRDTWYVPKVSQGVAVGRQTSQNTTVTTQDMTTTNVQVDNLTIAAYNDISIQALQFAGIDLDRELFRDLTRAYNIEVEEMVLASSVSNNEGIFYVSGSNSVTFTDGDPTYGELWAEVSEAKSKVHTERKAIPEAIVMHPRRWEWILNQRDSDGRPLVAPVAPQNAPGTYGNAAEGAVASWHGLPVIVSHSVPAASDDATPVDQDRVAVLVLSDLRLYEASPQYDIFNDVGSATLTVRFRMFNNVAFTAARQPKGISIISGTGLNAPTFA